MIADYLRRQRGSALTISNTRNKGMQAKNSKTIKAQSIEKHRLSSKNLQQKSTITYNDRAHPRSKTPEN